MKTIILSLLLTAASWASEPALGSFQVVCHLSRTMAGEICTVRVLPDRWVVYDQADGEVGVMIKAEGLPAVLCTAPQTCLAIDCHASEGGEVQGGGTREIAICFPPATTAPEVVVEDGPSYVEAKGAIEEYFEAPANPGNTFGEAGETAAAQSAIVEPEVTQDDVTESEATDIESGERVDSEAEGSPFPAIVEATNSHVASLKGLYDSQSEPQTEADDTETTVNVPVEALNQVEAAEVEVTAANPETEGKVQAETPVANPEPEVAAQPEVTLEAQFFQEQIEDASEIQGAEAEEAPLLPNEEAFVALDDDNGTAVEAQVEPAQAVLNVPRAKSRSPSPIRPSQGVEEAPLTVIAESVKVSGQEVVLDAGMRGALSSSKDAISTLLQDPTVDRVKVTLILERGTWSAIVGSL